MSGDEYPLPEDKLSVLDSILITEAERADAESQRVDAEVAREKACQEAVSNANSATARVNRELDTILSTIYPVGSIYMSMNSTSPATLFGGSWEQLKDRFLIGASNTYSAGGQGGSESHKHGSGTLSALLGQPDDAPSTQYGLKSSHPTYSDYGFTAPWIPDKTIYVDSATSGTNNTSNRGIDVSGQTGDTDTLPPYLAVYMWHRIA
jgi:hypothetical protein